MSDAIHYWRLVGELIICYLDKATAMARLVVDVKIVLRNDT